MPTISYIQNLHIIHAHLSSSVAQLRKCPLGEEQFTRSSNIEFYGKTEFTPNLATTQPQTLEFLKISLKFVIIISTFHLICWIEFNLQNHHSKRLSKLRKSLRETPLTLSSEFPNFRTLDSLKLWTNYLEIRCDNSTKFPQNRNIK